MTRGVPKWWQTDGLRRRESRQATSTGDPITPTAIRPSERHIRLSARHTRSSERHTRLSERHIRSSERHTRSSERHTRSSERHTRSSERHTRLSERHTRLSERHTRLSERQHDRFCNFRLGIPLPYPASTAASANLRRRARIPSGALSWVGEQFMKPVGDHDAVEPPRARGAFKPSLACSRIRVREREGPPWKHTN